MRPRRRSFPARVRVATLALVAAGAASVAFVPPVIGAGESAVRAAASAWDGVFGERAQPVAERRMIVVLEAPSVAERIAQAETPPSAEDQLRWVAEADASQRLLVARLEHEDGLAGREEDIVPHVLGVAELEGRPLLEELARPLLGPLGERDDDDEPLHRYRSPCASAARRLAISGTVPGWSSDTTLRRLPLASDRTIDGRPCTRPAVVRSRRTSARSPAAIVRE